MRAGVPWLLVAALLSVQGVGTQMQSGSDDDDNTAWFLTHARFTGSTQPQNLSTLELDALEVSASDADDEDVATPAPADADRSRDNRGSYARHASAARESHADQARRHWEAIEKDGLSNCCSSNCTGKCMDAWRKNDMFAWHERAYGVLQWHTAHVRRVSGHAYGKQTVHNQQSGCWSTTHTCNASAAFWRSEIPPVRSLFLPPPPALP